MFTPKPHAALVLIGHGSTLNPDSSAPTFKHADEIRRRGLFREVICCFWKEEPSMREVYAMLDSREVYLVPNFISEGYFCQEVLPRELQVTGPITQLGDKILYYCDPVGIHPNMTRLLLKRADEVAPGVPRSETSLVIVGHGTSLNENSRKVIEQQVGLIQSGGYGFAEVIDSYMEEAPFVKDWATLTTRPNVVVVPFFIADGLHSYQDIPVLLGMEAEIGAAASQREVFRHNPQQLQGRHLYFSNAIGTEELLADVVLDQVMEFDRRYTPSPQPEARDAIADWLRSKVEDQPLSLGQIMIRPISHGEYLLTHVDDVGIHGLETYEGWEAAREICKLDADDVFRPLKSAPTLRRGWRLHLPDIPSLRLALDAFYPAGLGLAKQEEERRLQAVPLREHLGRQTGMYRFTNTISDAQALELVASCCDTETKCLRRIAWDLAPGQPLTGPARAKAEPVVASGASLPLLCVVACPLFVGEARQVARNSYAQKMVAQDQG